MQDNRKKLEANLAKWRSAFRGHIWLGSILPFLFVCAGYFTSDLKTVCRLIIGLLLILNLFILYWRQDGIIQAMKEQGTYRKRSIWKRIVVKFVFLIFAVMITFLFNPIIPIYIQGLLSSTYYLAAVITWYQRLREHKKE